MYVALAIFLFVWIFFPTLISAEHLASHSGLVIWDKTWRRLCLKRRLLFKSPWLREGHIWRFREFSLDVNGVLGLHVFQQLVKGWVRFPSCLDAGSVCPPRKSPPVCLLLLLVLYHTLSPFIAFHGGAVSRSSVIEAHARLVSLRSSTQSWQKTNPCDPHRSISFWQWVYQRWVLWDPK